MNVDILCDSCIFFIIQLAMRFLYIVMMSVCMACQSGDNISVNISSNVINSDYMGNGVEWDPYDEAESWGSGISEKDWEKLYQRLDFMQPAYVRCMINSPFRYYNPQTGQYDKNRNIESISKLLSYCTDRGITVVFGEFNPPTWEMKDDQRWIDMSVDYLNYLVTDLNFTCIKYFVIFNEPDGDWASINGDYALWNNMLVRFHEKMKEYPGLLDKVRLAGPDVVANYRNPYSLLDTEDWLSNSVQAADSLIAIYDIHAYPGQHEVRTGRFSETLQKYRKLIPENKKIILGEAGYKYGNKEDSLLMAEYKRRVDNHPYTKGSDCNMLCYDYFYGLDMPILAMDIMNNGYSGLALWMLDDAMHSNGDSGKPEDIKIWGLWNILGSEVFNKPEEEELRPLFYTWSLMCRYFPGGTDILESVTSPNNHHLHVVAGIYNNKISIALANVGNTDQTIQLKLPRVMKNISLYVYESEKCPKDSLGFPVVEQQMDELECTSKFLIKANSFRLITEL